MCFPMVHLLRDAYPAADLHFICPKHHIEMLYALPFDGFWHEWVDEEVQTVLDVHRFAANLTLPKVDIYVALGDSLNDLVLGKFLNAKKRYGFGEGWKSWFLSRGVRRPVNHHYSEDFLYLYREFTNRRIPDDLKVKGKELPPFYKEDEPPYLAVDLWPFGAGKLDDFWAEFFALHEGKRFVLFSSQEEAKAGLLAERLVARLPGTNRYDLFLSPNWIELGKMLAHAKGLVTRAGVSASYATYLGTDTLVIYETGEPRRDAPLPFFANWQLMDLRDPTLIAAPAAATTATESAALKPRPMVSADQLFEVVSKMFYF